MNALLIIIKSDLITDLLTGSISGYIQRLNGWAKLLPNVWIVKTYNSAVIVRDELRQIIPTTGGVFVIDITKAPWASSNLANEITSWIKNNV